MPRRPKLVAVTALVPTYIRDALKRRAKREHRTLSAYISNVLKNDGTIDLSFPSKKELHSHGEENETR